MIKKYLIETCNELGIAIPEGATRKQLETAIRTYFEDAAVIKTDDGLRFIQTDKDTEEYTIDFIGIGYCTVRAESEEAARDWIEKNKLEYGYNLDFGYGLDAEIIEWELS